MVFTGFLTFFFFFSFRWGIWLWRRNLLWGFVLHVSLISISFLALVSFYLHISIS